MVRREEGRGLGVERGAWLTGRRWNLSGTLAGVVYSDDESQRPGGANWRGEKGEMERRSRAFYRRGERPNYSGSNGELNGGVIGGGDLVSGVKFGLRKKKAGLTGGARLSARGEEK
jgi:hypothetical protein